MLEELSWRRREFLLLALLRQRNASEIAGAGHSEPIVSPVFRFEIPSICGQVESRNFPANKGRSVVLSHFLRWKNRGRVAFPNSLCADKVTDKLEKGCETLEGEFWGFI